MISNVKALNWLVLSCTFLLLCCKKEEVTIPEPLAHFTNVAGGTFSVVSTNNLFKIPVGVTAVSDVDRTVNITVTSPSGAVQGTHYTLSSTSVVIPAGEAVDSLTIYAAYNQYLAGRKDTLIFTITGDGVKPSSYNSTYTLALRGPCFEGDVDLNAFLGDYDKSVEDFGGPYGPYTTTVTAVNQTSATTGTITVANIFDAGWNPVTFTLNWTDPSNRTVTLVQQSGIGNAGTVSSTYAGQDISVRPFAGQVGTFSACNQTITIKMQIGVTGLGFFGTLYTLNMVR